MREQGSRPASTMKEILFRQTPRITPREIAQQSFAAQPDPAAGQSDAVVGFGVFIV